MLKVIKRLRLAIIINNWVNHHAEVITMGHGQCLCFFSRFHRIGQCRIIHPDGGYT